MYPGNNFTLLEQNLDHGQRSVSDHRRMPVKSDVEGKVVTLSTPDTVQFYYYSNGVLTIDSGQPAGTPVVAKLSHENIRNALGDTSASYGDSSFSFVTGTVLTNPKPFRQLKAEDAEFTASSVAYSGSLKLAAVTSDFGNGDWCLDPENGVIYGVKKTTGVSDTANYKYKTTVLRALNASGSVQDVVIGDYIVKYDDAGSGITYIGYAAPGSSVASAVWQIFRLDESSSPDFDKLYADGVTTFTKVWNSRASYSYS